MVSLTVDRRLAALREYDILDTPVEVEFEDLVKLACAALDTPIAAINLIDQHRQWFKAEIGLGVREMPLDDSICAHALLEQDVLVIPDTTVDARLAQNALVHGEPHLRSYAGVLLKTHDGLPIGTLCVLDYRVRDFDAKAMETLRALSRQVMTQLEYRRALKKQAQNAAEQALSASALHSANLSRGMALQAARLGRWDHHPVTGERYFDERAREILGIAPGESIALDAMFSRTHAGDRERLTAALDRAMIADRTGPFDIEIRVVQPDGAMRWAGLMGRTLFENGECVRFLGVIQDVTERKIGEEQRRLVVNELNHRVKNSLAMAQAVVDASLRGATSLEQGRTVANSRIRALSNAHDILTAEVWSSAQVFDIVLATVDNLSLDPARVEIGGEGVRLGPRAALQLSLALHELATNACKYGSLSNDLGRVHIRWSVDRADPPRFRFSWQERGGPLVVEPAVRGFGSRLIERATSVAFAGDVAFRFDPEGVLWTIDAPLAGLEEER